MLRTRAGMRFSMAKAEICVVKGGIAFRENETAHPPSYLKSEFLACLFAGFSSNNQSEVKDCGNKR
jgi:hypothetical protein